jgi:hypothetical protein
MSAPAKRRGSGDSSTPENKCYSKAQRDLRVRDNQRRSRARKKEYVQELEQKLRRLEAQGTKASIEIQQAARKVADENTQLRALLHRYGADNEQISRYLRVGSGTPDAEAMSSAVVSQSVRALEMLLAPRPKGSTGLAEAIPHEIMEGSSPDSEMRDNLPASQEAYPVPVATVQDLLQAATRSTSNYNGPPTRATTQSPRAMANPLSMTPSPATPPSYLAAQKARQQQQQQQQQQHQQQHSRYDVPIPREFVGGSTPYAFSTGMTPRGLLSTAAGYSHPFDRRAQGRHSFAAFADGQGQLGPLDFPEALDQYGLHAFGL